MKRKNRSLKYNSRSSAQAGMTLVELMVVLAIFAIVTGITIFDYGRFKSSVSLQNLGDDIALSIRRAQNYAIGVRSSSSVFTNGYGIHFSTANPDPSNVRAGSNKAFIIFNDLPVANKNYDYSQTSDAVCGSIALSSRDECMDILKITSNDVVSAICPNGSNCSSGYADITFLRPNPDAYICVGSIGGPCGDKISSVDIVIENSQSHDKKTISVSNVGQISIK